MYENNASNHAYRGYRSTRYWTWYSRSSRYITLGFRPVPEILNIDPLISGTDRDLGDKNANSTIECTIDDTDAGDVFTATKYLDTRKTRSFVSTQEVKNTISVPVDTLFLGQYTAKVEVNDGQEGKVSRTWTFHRTNSTPTISGTGANLGDKGLGFTYEYTADDANGDELIVMEQFNGDMLRATNNAPKKETFSLTIDAEKLYSLGLNTANSIVIIIIDGKDGAVYRRLIFKRTNSTSTISEQDKDAGLQTGGFSEKYIANDIEGDNVVVTEFVDNKQIRSYKATLGQEETTRLSRENQLILTNGSHRLRIETVDGNLVTLVRVFAFQKEETVICFQPPEPERTDAVATKVLVTPTWTIEGTTARVEARNDAFNDVPTWEDITAQVMTNRVFMLQDKTKTTEKWGVDIRFTITKNEGYEGEVSISGFGGVYE